MTRLRRTFNVPTDELKSILDRPKYVTDDIAMSRVDGENECTYRQNLIYCADSGDTIAGAMIQFRSLQLPDFIYHSFALTYTHRQHQNFIMQLEVEPPQKISHKEDGIVIYGAHCVTLNYTESLSDDNTWNWHNWLAEFERRANLQIFGEKIKPFDGELF